MNLRRLLPTLLGVGLLASCGGGGSGPQVSSMQISGARFAGTATITLSGIRLDEGVSVSLSGPCETLTTVTGGTTETRQFTCDVTALGDIVAVARNGLGAQIGQVTATVPMPRVDVTTSLGTFSMELRADLAPKTVRNFLGYTRAGFYDAVLVHWAQPGRGIMSGGYRTGLRVKAPSAPAIELESNNGLKNLRGSVAMYRDAEPNSARARWFVNTADNADLDFVDEASPGYAVFGTVISGLAVVDTIAAVPTQADETTGLPFVPVTEVLVTDITQTR